MKRDGTITDGARINACLPTIEYLLNQHAIYNRMFLPDL